jgi:RimJ/RimL family protein N-acetyltransferase
MEIRLFILEDLQSLQNLLVSNTWEFFLDTTIDKETAEKYRDEKYFDNQTTKTLVYLDDDGTIQGYIRFYDIENGETPGFVVGVDEKCRGKGIGKALIHAGLKYIFVHFNTRRIEASTRVDNIPMQKLFEASGFTHEATYRKAWENWQTGEYVDSLGYAILREEFEAN